MALDDDSQGKTALLEFPEGWQRTIALPTQADAWHPMFDDLAEAEHKRLRAHVAPPVVFHPDGTRTRQGAMSFVRVEVNRVGGWLGERCFDVPPEDYNSGSITGYRCAGELLEALQRAYGPHIHLTDILDEVMATQNGSYGKSGRRGEAVAFMEVVKVTMAFFAKHVHHADYVAARIAATMKYHAYCIEQDAKERAAFVARMKAAREAKRSSVATDTPRHAEA